MVRRFLSSIVDFLEPSESVIQLNRQNQNSAECKLEPEFNYSNLLLLVQEWLIQPVLRALNQSVNANFLTIVTQSQHPIQ
jgi:hypothetical protein